MSKDLRLTSSVTFSGSVVLVTLLLLAVFEVAVGSSRSSCWKLGELRLRLRRDCGLFSPVLIATKGVGGFFVSTALSVK